MPQRFRRPWQSALRILLTTAIFGVDAFTRLDTAIAVIYVVVILLAAAIWPPAWLLLFGGNCMLLTLTAFDATTFGFSLVAISFALLTMAALSPHSLHGRVKVPGATSLALWSYSVYLMHKPIFMVVATQLRKLHIDIDTAAPLTVALMFGADIFGGRVLFQCVETPFMPLRARLYLSVRRRTGWCRRHEDILVARSSYRQAISSVF